MDQTKFDFLPFLEAMPQVSGADGLQQFRRSLCDEKLREIAHFQKLKRVTSLKEEMHKCSQRDDHQPAAVPLSIDTSWGGGEQSLNSISSILNRLDGTSAPFSPPGKAAATPLKPEHQEQLDFEAQIDEEMQRENLLHFKQLLQQMDEIYGDLYDSNDEHCLTSPSRDSPGKRKTPRKTARDSRDDGRSESEDEDGPIAPLHTPRVRYPRSSRSHSRKQSGRLSQPSPRKDRRDVNEDEEDGEATADDHFEAPGLTSITGGASNLASPALSLPLISEEIVWELRLPRSLVTMDSKLFFFQNILWRVTFGINNLSEEFYYFFISPAEKLKSFASLSISFLVHPNGTSSSTPFTRSCGQNFTFPQEYTVSRGYEKFIHKDQLRAYLSNSTGAAEATRASQTNFFSLRLSVAISSNLGPNGELIGCLHLSH
jgi:hypothetical protein